MPRLLAWSLRQCRCSGRSLEPAYPAPATPCFTRLAPCVAAAAAAVLPLQQRFRHMEVAEAAPLPRILAWAIRALRIDEQANRPIIQRMDCLAHHSPCPTSMGPIRPGRTTQPWHPGAEQALSGAHNEALRLAWRRRGAWLGNSRLPRSCRPRLRPQLSLRRPTPARPRFRYHGRCRFHLGGRAWPTASVDLSLDEPTRLRLAVARRRWASVRRCLCPKAGRRCRPIPQRKAQMAVAAAMRRRVARALGAAPPARESAWV